MDVVGVDDAPNGWPALLRLVLRFPPLFFLESFLFIFLFVFVLPPLGIEKV
jgi:hypothetical protein